MIMTFQIDPLYYKASLTADEKTDSQIVHYSHVELTNHSLLSFTSDECSSKLRVLRVASAYYPILSYFFHAIYEAVSSHRCTSELDTELRGRDFKHTYS